MPAEAALPSFADLQRELSPTSPRAWRFAALRACSRAGALLSDGLRIGYRHGFDSGPFMAHVYANRPSGRTVVGRAIDRRLLGRRTCVAFRDIRALAERAVFDALRAERGPAPVVADLAAGPGAVPALGADAATRAPAPSSADTDPERARRPPAATPRRSASPTACSSCRPTPSTATRCSALRPSPDVVVELGLYGIYHDDALIERHLHDLAALVAPSQIVFNVQTRNPEIEHIARVWVNHDGRALRVAPAAGRADPRVGARRRLRAGGGRGRPLRHLPRRAARARGRGGMTQRADLGAPPAPPAAIGSRRLRRSAGQPPRDVELRHLPRRDRAGRRRPRRALPRGHHAPARRLGRPRLADVLPRAARVGAGGDARRARARRARRLPARPDRAAARRGGARARPRARRQLRGRRHRGRAGRARRWRCWPPIDPGDEVILGDPGYFHLPAAVLAAGGVPGDRRRSARRPAIASTPTPWRRRSRRARARSASSTRVNPYGTAGRATTRSPR